jgi:hypothetical protein
MLNATLYPADGSVELRGTPEEFAQFADWMRAGVERVAFRFGGVGRRGKGSESVPLRQARLHQGAAERLSICVVEGVSLRILGGASQRNWLADVIGDFADQTQLGAHFHLECFPGHPFLGSESVPIVLSLEEP